MIPFVKMHGIGNDFVILDGIRDDFSGINLCRLAQSCCQRHIGIGADGLIILDGMAEAVLHMRMFNPDGSESGMCGNGLRCLARLAHWRGYANIRGTICLGGQNRNYLIREDRQVQVDMTGLIGVQPGPDFQVAQGNLTPMKLEVAGSVVVGTALSVGNPHFIIASASVANEPIATLGPIIENLPVFPNRTNVHWMERHGDGSIRMRTWERGAGETLACGSGAFATAIVAHQEDKLNSPIDVHLPGGRLLIGLGPQQQTMTGPAEYLFEGLWGGLPG